MKTPRSLITRLLLIGLGFVLPSLIQAQTFTPVPLTPNSFSYNMVVPVDWQYKLNQQSVTVTIDHGPQLQATAFTGFPTYYSVQSGDTFFEIGCNRASATTLTTYGLPAGGSLLTNVTYINHVYQLPYWSNYNSNCVCIGNWLNNGTLYNSQPLVAGPYTYPTNNPYNAPSLALNNANNYTALSFLVSGGGPNTCSMTIQYADGTSQGPVSFGVPNWFVNSAVTTTVTPSASFAYTALARCNPAYAAQTFTISSGVNSGSRLWSVDVALSDTTSAPTNVNFAWVSGNAAASVIIGVSGSTNAADNATIPNTGPLTGGPFTPIPVSGYNAGFVVANSPQTFAGLAPLTATMDQGTNLAGGANTWFEVGWDQAAPANGFPAHGTILTSVANPTRTYQMPASYHQAMSTLVDHNHLVATITPQTPGTYSAFSLLTCGASINNGSRMTNTIILQHSNGVNETNLFIGYDWFEATQPYAFTANERVNIGSSTSTSGRNVDSAAGHVYGTYPRLFESQFQMQDGSPVTNIVLGYLMAPGANSTTYVIAVSATTNFIPVQVGSYTPAQNVYAGQSAVFSITMAFGTLPTFQWQFTDGATFTNNLVNGLQASGATISGATTTTLTVSNVSASDVGYYTCLVGNSIPSSTNSTLAPLTLLVSTLGNVVRPGDPMSDFGEIIASPAGLTVPNVIDGTLATYLNYGASGGTAGPFTGPVGIIVTPTLGSSAVSALRFVVAVNAPICDPADFALDGSNDGGATWTPVVADMPLSLPVQRNLSGLYPTGLINLTNQVLQEVDFVNTTNYVSYRLTVHNVRDNSANSMQIAEVQFLGTQALIAPGVVQQPVSAKTILAGGSYTMSLVASGPTPYSYQWYLVRAGATNAVPDATNAVYTLANAQLTNSGSYFCMVSNSYGATASSFLNLTVIAPTVAYQSTVLADGPIAYWRLDEGNGNPAAPAPDNLVANDYVGNHNGAYTNCYIGEPGYSAFDSDTAAEVGPAIIGFDSFVGQITGINFVTPTNQKAAFSVEAWVQNPFSQAQTVAGAGIISYGYGGGGEQFALDCGGTSNNFRFFFRDATLGTNVFGNPAHLAIAPASGTGDGQWHHLVGVLDEVHTNQYLYVDGRLVATTGLATNLGIQQPSTPLSLGSRASTSTTNHNLQFNGYIDEVAIYPYALSSNQVAAHYFSAGIPPSFTAQPTNTSVSEGATANFYAPFYGAPPLYSQWYRSIDGGGTFAPVPGQTGATLSLANVPPALNNYQYYLQVTNAYGATNSAVGVLTVISGPPQIQPGGDLASAYLFLAGFPFSLPVSVGGTPPLTYAWFYDTTTALQDGGRISGSHSNVLTIANAQLSDSGTYQLSIGNPNGGAFSQPATVTIAPVLGFNGLGSQWAVNGNASYIGNNLLQLTTGTAQTSSSFFDYPVYVGAFQASWTYQDVGGAGADGACFVIQNAARGASALGGAGGGLGVTGITNSAELEFNIYSGNAFGGVGFAFSTNGVVANVTAPYPLNIASGDPISVTLTCLNGIASLVLTDATASVSYSTSVAFPVAAAIGGNTAYVGFTGASGGTGSQQQVSDFNFVSLVGLTAQSSTPGSVVFSWPVGVGAYVLQQSPTLVSPSWTNVGGTAAQVGEEYQQSVSSAGAPNYYRLHLQYTPQ